MKKIILYILLVFICNSLFGQIPNDSTKSTKNISFEFIGNGVLYSIKYENCFSNNKKLRYIIGVSYIPEFQISIFKGSLTYVFLPEVVSLIGKNKKKLEIGIGIRYELTTAKPDLHLHFPVNDGSNPNDLNYNLYFTSRIGYRYEGEKNIFKIAFVPVLLISGISTQTPYEHSRIFPLIGISYGRILNFEWKK